MAAIKKLRAGYSAPREDVWKTSGFFKNTLIQKL